MNVDVLLINALVYIATFLFALKRAKRLNIYVLIWGVYSLVAFMGFYSVRLGYHYSQDINLGYKVDFAPYICAYLIILLITNPFRRFDETKINFDITFPKIFKDGIKIVFCLLVLQSFFNGVNAVVVMKTIGFGESYLMHHDGESINVFSFDVITRFRRLAKVITEAVLPFYVTYYYIKLVKHEGNVKKNIVCIILAFLPMIFSALAAGSKGALFFVSFNIIFYYLLFRPRLSKSINRKITFVGIIAASAIVFYVLAITVSRIEASGKVADNKLQEAAIIHYLGEAFPNLGYFYYDKVVSHPYGRRFFPEFFADNAENHYKTNGIDAKFDYWTPKTGVPMALFKTFWGDWYVEFGFFGSFLALLTVYAFFYFLWLKRYSSFSNIGGVAFYYTYIVIQGCFTGSGIEGSAKHKSILLLIVICHLLKKKISNDKQMRIK